MILSTLALALMRPNKIALPILMRLTPVRTGRRIAVIKRSLLIGPLKPELVQPNP
jgi:hypothetical protein